jgi:hypothetical protein
MSTQSQLTIQFVLQGDENVNQTYQTQPNTNASGADDVYALIDGNNNIIKPPVGADNGFILIPPANNTQTLTWKGTTSGDVGTELHPTQPHIQSLAPGQAGPFILASTGPCNVRIKWW